MKPLTESLNCSTKEAPTGKNHMNTSNQQLIQLCLQGKQKAQRTLYEQYAVQMYRICWRYLRNEQDTEEVLANGFVKVFKNLEKVEYRDDRSFEAWIKRIMVNESLMHIRKRKNFTLISISDAPPVEDNLPTDSNLATEDIYALILQLPDGYRTIFNLYAIEGYSHKEIAERLNISVNTSKSQLSKARALLRTMISNK